MGDDHQQRTEWALGKSSSDVLARLHLFQSGPRKDLGRWVTTRLPRNRSGTDTRPTGEEGRVHFRDNSVLSPSLVDRKHARQRPTLLHDATVLASRALLMDLLLDDMRGSDAK